VFNDVKMVHLAAAFWLCCWRPGPASVAQFTAEYKFSFIYPQEAETVYKLYTFDKIKGLENERSGSDLLALLLTQMTVYVSQWCFPRWMAGCFNCIHASTNICGTGDWQLFSGFKSKWVCYTRWPWIL